MKNIRRNLSFVVLVCFSFVVACQTNLETVAQEEIPKENRDSFLSTRKYPTLAKLKSDEIRAILESAHEQISTTTSYTQKYFNISYPNGDVPKSTGACTDVVIRSFRAAGIDLQREVHEDMTANFSKYPKKWGLPKPDTNIDHRRVPNLQVYFQRKGKSLAVSEDGGRFKPGDVVSWDLNGKGMTHIGLVSSSWNEKEKRYLIIHNIGGGTKLEDRLFEWEITGHFRYFE